MHPLDLAIFDGDQRLDLPTERAEGLEIVTGPRGLQSVSASLPLSTVQAYDLYRRLGQARAVVSADGAVLSQSRIEDAGLSNGGVEITALGPWRELSDLPYTALWSASGVEGWFPLGPGYNPALAAHAPELFEIDVDEWIKVSLIKGTSYPATGPRVGAVAFRVPYAGDRGITGVQFRVRLLVPTNWQFAVRSYASSLFPTPPTSISSITSAGTLTDRGYHLTLSAAGAMEFIIFNNTGGVSTPAGETGSWYMIISDLRVVTSTTNRVNTTLTANRAAGSSVTATVGSTAGMYVGMQLVINSGAATSEIVTVESITSSTQFVATFVNSYTSGQAVQGFKVRADEVVAALPAYVTGINTGGVLSSSTAFVQACDRDLLNAAWEDTTPADIIAELAERGSSTSRYEAQVWGDGVLRFHPVGTYSRDWYVDAADLTIEQTLDGLINSVYPRYQDASGRTLRGTTQVDTASVQRYGLTRRGAVDADTTNATIAGLVALNALDQSADPIPRASLSTDRVYTASGALAPLHEVRAGDSITIRNLPPSAGQAVNRIQTFRLAETRLQQNGARLVLTPESPLPDIEHQQAAIYAAAEVAASLSGTPAAIPVTLLAPQQARRRNPVG